MKKSRKKKKNYKLYIPKLFINKIIKRDIMIYSILVISLITLTTTSSYAYLSTKVNTVQLQNVVSSTIEGVELINSQININSLTPSIESEVLSSFPSCKYNEKEICSMYEFTVNNTNGEVAKNVAYSLVNINNTFNNLKFKIYEGSKDNVTSSKIVLMNSDKLTPNIKELELTGLNKYIKANEIQTYTIVFYIEKVENQEIYDALKEFNANILIDLKTTGYVGE